MTKDKEGFIPIEKTVEGAEELVYGDRVIVVERACTYKTIQAAKKVAGLIGLVDVASIVPNLLAMSEHGAEPVHQALLAIRIIPMLAEEAPDALIDLAALLMTPNAELANEYSQANGIKDLVESNRQWLLFDAPTEASLTIVSEFLPYLGLDALKNALSPLAEKLKTLLPAEE